MMIIYIAGLQNVPDDLIEAKRLTERKWDILWKIRVPMVMSSITICVFLTLTNSFKLFDQNLALTGGDPNHATEMLALNIYQTFYARAGMQWKGYGQAKAVIFCVLVIIISLVQLKATRSKEVRRVMKKKKSIANTIWIVILTIAALAWIYPIIMILMNSLKKESAISTGTAFKLPTADAFAGIANYVDAVASKGFLSSLGYSTFITITSVVAILVCCSMCAWYITRVNSPISKILYYLFVFSMVVPFQMVMFTLSQTADTLHLNMPWNIWVIYLGFGAGLAVFMFCGFVKSIPVEIEEVAMIDGCNPRRPSF